MKPALLILTLVLLSLSAFSANDSTYVKSELRKLDKSDLSWEEKELKARELRDISIDIGYTDGEMHACYILATTYFFRQHYQSAFEVLDSLLDKLESGNSDRSMKNIENKKARVYAFMGTIYDEIGDFAKAMDWYLKALKYVDANGDQFQKSILYKNLGMTNLSVGNVPKASEYFTRSLKICDSINDKKTKFDILNSLQHHYVSKSKYDSALVFAYKLVEIAREIGDDYSVAMATYSLGNVYLESGNSSLSQAYLKEALIQSKKNNFRTLISQSLIGLSKTNSVAGNHSEALTLALEAYNIALKINSLTLNIDASERLYLCYAALEDYNNAYKTSLDFQKYKTEESKKNNAKAVMELQARYEMDNVNSEKKMLEGQLMLKQSHLKNQRLSLIASVAGILLLAALLIMQIRKYRHVRSLNSRLENQQLVINEQAEKLHKEQEHILKLEIEHKNREMTSIALALAQENEFKENLVKELEELKLGLSQKKADIRNLNTIINSVNQSMSSNSWEEFRTYFGNVYSEFYDNIEAQYPFLSQNDKRLCAMIKLGLSTKEISLLTYREIKSVESARNRLRKKFGLDPKENLAQFLCKF